MIGLFLAASLQPTDLRALDRAHDGWARCVVTAGASLAPRSSDAFSLTEAAQRACAREEAAVRKALTVEHPAAPSAEIDSLLDRFRSRIRGLLWRQPWVRTSGICARQPSFTLSLGAPETLVERMDLAESFYQGCHGRANGQSARVYWSYDDGRLRRQAPGRAAAPGGRQMLSLHIQDRGEGVATAWLTWWDTTTRASFCHFHTKDLSDASLDERSNACFRSLGGAAGAK
jgi:hypothetical protein